MIIDQNNLQRQYELYKHEIDSSLQHIMQTSDFIMGQSVNKLERELEAFANVNNAVTCSSGTDALQLALMAINVCPGDEVITTPFTFIAAAEMIAHLKAVPVFVDIDESTYNIDVKKIEMAITQKTKAIIPVSLYGQPCDMDAICDIADCNRLDVIIDGAQSFGSTYKGITDSNLGTVSCTSFFPSKPLGCYGDGGAIFTNDENLSDNIRSFRNHGQYKRYNHRYIGLSGRLDTMQAAILLVKLHYYSDLLKKRKRVADIYYETLSDKNIILPKIASDCTSTWAQYVIRVKNRDKLMAKLNEMGILATVHYPIPLHLQECFAYLGYKRGDFATCEKVTEEIISIPINPYMTDREVRYVSSSLLSYL